MASPAVLDLSDIQGIMARGYTQLRSARYCLFRFQDGSAARSWLGALEVTSAASRGVNRVVNVALTADGLAVLGLDPTVLEQLDPSFVSGMTDSSKSRLLGDVDSNAPELWQWGGPATDPIHAMVVLLASSDAELEEAHSSLLAALPPGVEEVHRLETFDQGDREPFGFRDGISQPLIEGLSKTGPDINTVRAGEFLLGYLNEYGLYTDRPLLPQSSPHADLLPSDEAGSGSKDLARNGSYLVMRTLHQDVFGFWRYLDSATRGEDGAPDREAQIRLGAQMVGRWPGGAPLVLSPDRDDPSLSDATDFTYHGPDASGFKCPIGAHVRRSNPRDSLGPGPGSAQSIAVGKRHRLLRRGREYGPPIDPARLAEGLDDGVDRGLQFACLCANLGRQFEFIQHTWVENPKFTNLYEDADPLVSSRRPGSDSFTIQAQPVRTRLRSLPKFVSVRGGAYFFLPGLRAIRYLAALGT